MELAALPAHRLVLGRDSYGAPARLEAVLGPVMGEVVARGASRAQKPAASR